MYIISQIEELGRDYLQIVGRNPTILMINQVDFKKLLREHSFPPDQRIERTAVYIHGSKVDLREHVGALELV